VSVCVCVCVCVKTVDSLGFFGKGKVNHKSDEMRGEKNKDKRRVVGQVRSSRCSWKIFWNIPHDQEALTTPHTPITCLHTFVRSSQQLVIFLTWVYSCVSVCVCECVRMCVCMCVCRRGRKIYLCVCVCVCS